MIYVISEPDIVDEQKFLSDLQIICKKDYVKVFQLRLKNCKPDFLEQIAVKSQQICTQNQVAFIVNDNLDLANKINADGVHLGSDDYQYSDLRRIIESNPTLAFGISCYDSGHLAMVAAEAGASYVSFGAFFESTTKKSRGAPELEILSWWQEISEIPVVAIGGINNQNIKLIKDAGADFAAVISVIWQSPQGVSAALDELYSQIL